MHLARKASPFLGLATLAALGLSAARPAAAQTDISFSGITGNGRIATYQEAGFTVTFTSGAWFGSTHEGNPAPDVFAEIPSVNPYLDVTRMGGGAFTFTSVDLAGFRAPDQSYTITGLSGTTPVFTQTGTVPSYIQGGEASRPLPAPTPPT